MTRMRLHGLHQHVHRLVTSLTDRKMSGIIERANTSHARDNAQDKWTKGLIELMLSK